MHPMNKDIRLTIRGKGKTISGVARALGIAETTLHGWLRKDLTPEKRERIIKAIEKAEF